MTTIKDVTAGTAHPDDLEPWQRAGLSMQVYRDACRILDLPGSQRKAAGEALPEAYRDLVREECQRLISYRNKHGRK